MTLNNTTSTKKVASVTNKVYILMDGGHDYSAAKEFGELVMCNLPPSASYDVARVYALLKEAMFDMQETDYIVISGLTTFCCVATALAMDWCSRVNLLLFSDGKYLAKTIVSDTTYLEPEES
jgi:hypothetical protein